MLLMILSKIYIFHNAMTWAYQPYYLQIYYPIFALLLVFVHKHKYAYAITRLRYMTIPPRINYTSVSLLFTLHDNSRIWIFNCKNYTKNYKLLLLFWLSLEFTLVLFLCSSSFSSSNCQKTQVDCTRNDKEMISDRYNQNIWH